MTIEGTLTSGAEQLWLQSWTRGPHEFDRPALPAGAVAPDAVLLDDSGAARRLSQFWSTGPALVIFWRHFGCGCGTARAERLRAEMPAYLDAGLDVVVVGQGEPQRAAAYRTEHEIPCPILSDPELTAYRAYGLGHWPVERVLYDAPPPFWSHAEEIGRAFQDERRRQGRPPEDDPWRATGEFVVSSAGRIRLPYYQQYCDDHPDPRVLTTAARLARTPASP